MKRLAVNLAVLVIACGVMLAAFEGYLRIFYNPTLIHRQMTEFDPVLGWRLRPGHYEVRRSEILAAHTIDINQLGMRNREITVVPPTDSTRVVLLGDSFTFGMLVPSAELLSTVAERTLNDDTQAGMQVVNIGAQGYGTAHQLLFTRQLLDQGFCADLYLVVFVLNDLLDNLRLSYDTLAEQPVVPGFALDATGRLYMEHAPERRFIEGGSLTSRPRQAFRLYAWGFVRSRLVDFVATRPELVRLAQRLGVHASVQRLPASATAWYDESVVERGWPLTRALLRELRHDVEERGARFGMVVIPSPFQVYESHQLLLRRAYPDNPQAQAFLEDPWLPQRMVAAFCREEGVPRLDLGVAFRSAADGPSLYSSKDHHFSKRGHQVAGEEIARFVREILPSPAMRED